MAVPPISLSLQNSTRFRGGCACVRAEALPGSESHADEHGTRLAFVRRDARSSDAGTPRRVSAEAVQLSMYVTIDGLLFHGGGRRAVPSAFDLHRHRNPFIVVIVGPKGVPGVGAFTDAAWL